MRWEDARKAQMNSQMLNDQLESIRAAHSAKSEIAAGVVFEVDNEDELAKVSKYQQADASLHTVESWETRLKLRREATVRNVLQDWWKAMVRTLRQTLPDDVVPIVEERAYIRMYHTLFRVLSAYEGEEYDPEEATCTAMEDWASDCRGASTMSRELFMDCIFQLADL